MNTIKISFKKYNQKMESNRIPPSKLNLRGAPASGPLRDTAGRGGLPEFWHCRNHGKIVLAFFWAVATFASTPAEPSIKMRWPS
jgi:hypothetical protein